MDFDQPFAAEVKPVAFRVLFAIKYQGMTGSLMLSMIETRPNIAFATSIASHFAKKSKSPPHWSGQDDSQIPPKGLKDRGIVYGEGTFAIEGYSDSEWAGDKESRKINLWLYLHAHGNKLQGRRQHTKHVLVISLCYRSDRPILLLEARPDYACSCLHTLSSPVD